jgi:hypothetical protein
VAHAGHRDRQAGQRCAVVITHRYADGDQAPLGPFLVDGEPVAP